MGCCAGHEGGAAQHARGPEELVGRRPVGPADEGLEAIEAFAGLEGEEVGGGEGIGHGSVRYQRLAPRTKCSISSTAVRMPAITARLTTLWPMLSSSISGIAATGHHVAVGEAVAGVDEESHVGGVPRGAAQLVERRVALAPGVGVAAGVQLDGGHAEVLGGVERGGVGIDEEAHPGAGLVQPADGLAQARDWAG